MAFYNEIFIEEKGKLIHIGSCAGSDAPSYFCKVKNINDWSTQLAELKKNNSFYPHGEKHPFPWTSYKTSDFLIVLRPYREKWFEFWKATHKVWVSVDKYGIKDSCKSYFVKIDKWVGDGDYDKKDLIILEFKPISKPF